MIAQCYMHIDNFWVHFTDNRYYWYGHIGTNTNIYVIVIPQYKYNILVITQVWGEAEDAGNN